jgi:hypothetical protein
MNPKIAALAAKIQILEAELEAEPGATQSRA